MCLGLLCFGQLCLGLWSSHSGFVCFCIVSGICCGFGSVIPARLVVFRFGCLFLSRFGFGLVVSFCLGQALVRLVCLGWVRLGLVG